MARSPSSTLQSLENLKERFTATSDREKAAILDSLEDVEFRRASEVKRFHELLCLMRAYPDGSQVLSRVDRLLKGFDRRKDLRKFAEDLCNTGIAGTRIDYEFYWVTANWLCRHWPSQLQVDWEAPFPKKENLQGILRCILPSAESILLDECVHSPRGWLDVVRNKDETDAAFLVRRFRKMRCNEATRVATFESLDMPMSLLPGPRTPSRTKIRVPGSPIAWQTRPRSRKRPNLRRAVRDEPLSTRLLSRSEGRRMISLARQSMVTRAREVDAFANASADDVRIVDWGQGLQFIGMGCRPAERHILESVSIFLIVNNGMPVGYVQPCVLFGSAEVNFNVFESFRGADAGWLYGRSLATIRHLTNADCFVLDPYQLGGDGNIEGLRSGAWWFYYKMGFRPRDADILALAREEMRKVRADRGYRTPIAVLRELSEGEMYLFLDKRRDDILSVLPLDTIGVHVSSMLANRFGSNREKGIRTCVAEARAVLGIPGSRRISAYERLAWRNWGPLLVSLSGLQDWTSLQKREAAAVVYAKGGRHESDYQARLDQHTALRAAIVELAHRPIEE